MESININFSRKTRLQDRLLLYGSRLRTVERIPFERNINDSTYNYIPERPNNVDPDYTWGGWYADADLTTPYSFSTMPSNNLVLYANHMDPLKTAVSFNTNGEGKLLPCHQHR